MRKKNLYTESNIRALFYRILIEEMLEATNIRSLKELKGVEK